GGGGLAGGGGGGRGGGGGGGGVAGAAPGEPPAPEFACGVAPAHRRGRRRCRVVHQHPVAIDAGEDEQVTGRGGDSGAGQLPRRIAHRRDDRNAALQTPARRGPVGEAQQIPCDTARGDGTNGRRPDPVHV